MGSLETMERIRQMRIVPAVRVPSADYAKRAVAALVAGGITVVEIPVTVPGVYQLIAEIRKTSGQDILIGAGTVIDTNAAKRAIQAGAQFIVSPCLNLDVIACCKRQDVAIMPGALTPTEIVTAWQAEADCIKVFPVSALGGVSYLKAIRAPLSKVPLMPMGGVSIEDAAQYIRAGALAIGVGSDLVDVAVLAQNRDDVLTRKAKEYVTRVREVQQGNSLQPNSISNSNKYRETIS